MAVRKRRARTYTSQFLKELRRMSDKYHLTSITSFPIWVEGWHSILYYKFYFKEIKDLKNCKDHLKSEVNASLILKFYQIEKSLPVYPHTVFILTSWWFLLSGVLFLLHAYDLSTTSSSSFIFQMKCHYLMEARYSLKSKLK